MSVTQPTLRWANPAGTTAARISICRDRACATVVTEFDAEGTTARVPNDLGPGVWFWNLRAIDRGVVSVLRSATWSFHTPATNAPIEVSRVFRPDVNGDGIDDFVVASCGGGINPASLYLGGGGLIPTARWPTDVRTVGDIDGDGYTDIYAAESSTSAILFGGSTDVSSLRTIQRRTWPAGEGVWFAPFEWSRSVGDFNGDGYGDALFSDGGPGRDSLVYGSPSGWSSPQPLPDFPTTFGAIGYDVDADGFDDVVTGAAVWYRGSPTGLVGPLVFRPSEGPGVILPLGDVDGDGYLDAVQCAIAAENTPLVLIRGSAAGPVIGDRRPSVPTDHRVVLGNAGDLDHDGRNDLLFYYSSPPDPSSTLIAYRGSPDGFSSADTFSPSIPFSYAVTGPPGARSIGDWNNDGHDDHALWVGTNVHLHIDSGTPDETWIALPVESAACYFE